MRQGRCEDLVRQRVYMSRMRMETRRREGSQTGGVNGRTEGRGEERPEMSRQWRRPSEEIGWGRGGFSILSSWVGPGRESKRQWKRKRQDETKRGISKSESLCNIHRT